MTSLLKTGALAAIMAAGGCVGASAPRAQTEIMFFFDAEDYTSDRPNDALRDLCNLFRDEGMTVHVALVGQLAREIARYGRKDVVEALSHHAIGTQSMYHSLHPNIMELSDEADYKRAYEQVYAQERTACEEIRRVTGQWPFFAVPPGNSKSYVAADVYADLGVKFYCDTVCSRDETGGEWYQNLIHIPYSKTFWIEALIPGQEGGIAGKDGDALGINWTKALDEIASRPSQILFLHPCMAVNAEFWDSVNYNKGNFCAFGKWNVPRRRPAADTALYYARIRELLRRLKRDGRFSFVTLAGKAAAERPRQPIRRDMCRDFSDALFVSHFERVPCGAASIEWFEPTPGEVWTRQVSYSLAEVFQAAVTFLRDDSVLTFAPLKAYGFLEKPTALERPVPLKAADLRETAKKIDLSRHLPASIDVGGTKVGPADFLKAALDVLATGKDVSEVSPSDGPIDPLGDLARFPLLKDFHPAGSWVFYPAYKDEYTSDRLRWQVWTWRCAERETWPDEKPLRK
ncbi:MAG: hypothetical protein IJ829_05985 [Kiritimatiellae bacterium]|nr:hypothetical protein [Kiritimatiellia bacterium]